MIDAKRELDVRLSRGEISLEEYEILLNTIGNSRGDQGEQHGKIIEENRSNGGSFFSFLLILIAVGVIATGLINIVKTNAGFKFYPKKEFSFQDPYIDMTRTSFIGLRKHH